MTDCMMVGYVKIVVVTCPSELFGLHCDQVHKEISIADVNVCVKATWNQMENMNSASPESLPAATNSGLIPGQDGFEASYM